MGLREVDRNTPTIANVALNRWFGWDGANDSLWAQSLRPLLDEREMGGSGQHVAGIVRGDADYLCRFRKVFARTPEADDEAVLVDAAKALAAFQEAQMTARTPFDDFRDALARKDLAAAARYPENAQRGLRVFVGKGSCNLCHFGPNFTNGEFHEIGIPIYRKTGGVDWGRHQGIKMLQSSRFNLLGQYNDDAARSTATSTRHVTLAPQTFEQFKVPSLRNVALTAPYMHNGHLATLRDVVRHYSEIDVSQLHAAHIYVIGEDDIAEPPPTDTLLKPLRLTAQEIDDVVAFLETLTERGGPRPIRRPAALLPCR
jgi:cytochrome c peroxidase